MLNYLTYIHAKQRDAIPWFTTICYVSHFLNLSAIRENIPLQFIKTQENQEEINDCFTSITSNSVLTLLREFSSRRNSKTRLGVMGSQNEVEALKTIPRGLPGSSVLFLVITRTSLDIVGDNNVQTLAVEAPAVLEKLITILSANFSILFLPSGVVITVKTSMSKV